MSENNNHNDWLEEEKRFCEYVDDFMGGNKQNTDEKVGAPKTDNKIKVCEDVNEAFNEIANHYVEYKKPQPKEEEKKIPENKESVQPSQSQQNQNKKKKNNKKSNQSNKPKINLDDDNYDEEYDDTYDDYYD